MGVAMHAADGTHIVPAFELTSILCGVDYVSAFDSSMVAAVTCQCKGFFLLRLLLLMPVWSGKIAAGGM